MRKTDSLTAPANALSPPRPRLGGWRFVLALLLLLGTGRAYAQAPVLANIEGTTLAYAQGQAATQITNTLTVADPDNATLTSARVVFSSGFVSGQDNLYFINQNGITGSYSTGTGVLTMTGSATLATYQTALRSVGYLNTNTTAAAGGNRVVQFTVSDGTNTSNAQTRTIAVAGNAPTVVSVTRLNPSPTATTSVQYQVVFSRNVTNVTFNNFTVTATGAVSGASVSSTVGPLTGTTYTVTVNTGTGTGNGTLRLNVSTGAGITPAPTNVPFAGEVYAIVRSFGTPPLLSLRAAGSYAGNGDVTAFIDQVRVVQNGTGTAVANAVQNGGFETNNVPAGDFLYAPQVVAAPWSFGTQAGVSRNGSAFGSTASQGDAVALLQSTGGNNGSIAQNLAVPAGTYQVNFQAIQRSSSSDQRVNVFLVDGSNTVFMGAYYPDDTNYLSCTSAAFSVTPLTATVSTTSASPTSTAPIPFAVSFSQNVGTTFTASDVTVTGGTITGGSFAGSGSGPYTFTVTPSGPGTVAVSLAANVAQDANTIGNSASNTVSVQSNAPAVTAAPVITAPVNGSVTNQAVTISGTAPDGSDVTIYLSQNGGAFQDIGTYPTTGGTFSSVPYPFPSTAYRIYATAQSPGGAVSANSNSVNFTVDKDKPNVAISSTAGASGGTTTTTPIPFTVTFSENVTGFVAGDVTVTNGTITGGVVNGTSPGTTYTFSVTPTTAGTATTVDVPANVAVDPANNGNTAAPQYSITYSQPVTAAPVITSPANGSVATQGLSFSGTAPANSTVLVYVSQNGNAFGPLTVTATAGGTFSSSPISYPPGTYQVYATAQSPGATVSANSAVVTFTANPPTPTVVLTSTAGASGSATPTTPFPFTATFSEPVGGFSASGITVTNGTVTGGVVNGNGRVYTFSVTPTTPGTATTVTVAANAAQSSGTVGNTPSNTYSLTYQPDYVTWTGAVSTDWFTAGNWTPAAVPTATTDATIPGAPSGGRFPAITSTAGTANVRYLALDLGATLTQTGGTLALAGNLINNGTFRATGGTVTLGSTTLGSVQGNSNTRFWNLTVQANGARLATSAATSVQRVLTLNGNLATNGSFVPNSNPLTLESDATGTAMVVNNGSAVVNGTVTVQRYIDPRLNPNLGYRHVSAPIGNATVASLATATFTPVVNPAYNASATPDLTVPFPTVYGYDQARLATSPATTLSTFDKGWFSPAALSTPLAVGQGYTVLARANQTWTFTGPLTNGNVTLPLARNSDATAPDAGYAFIGNPYPSPLDWYETTLDPGALVNVGATMYVYQSNDPANPYTGVYRFFNNGIGNTGSVVPVGQGFFVRVASGQTSGSVTFKNAHRPTTYANPTYLRTAAETRPLVELHLQGTGSAVNDAAFVYFEQGATDSFDAQYDAEKLPNPSGLNLSTSLSATQRLAIDGRAPLGTTQHVVPLAVGVPAAGSYTLNAAQVLNLGTTPVYLRDLQSGAVIDLRAQSSYSFTVSNASALMTGRFELVFSPQAVLATAPAALAAQVGLYPNPATGAAFVELPAALGRTAVSATLVDALGRPVRTQQLPAQGATAHRLALAELATGVYTLHLKTSAGVIVKKLVVE
jgi:hypothetical protein